MIQKGGQCGETNASSALFTTVQTIIKVSTTNNKTPSFKDIAQFKWGLRGAKNTELAGICADKR